MSSTFSRLDAPRRPVHRSLLRTSKLSSYLSVLRSPLSPSSPVFTCAASYTTSKLSGPSVIVITEPDSPERPSVIEFHLPPSPFARSVSLFTA